MAAGVDDSADRAAIAGQLLRNLAHLPEQSNQKAAAKLAESKGRYPVAADDVDDILRGWFDGHERIDLFVALPYVKRSRRQPPLEVWLEGQEPESSWADEFELFAEFIDIPVSTFLPWVCRAIGILQPYLGAYTGPARQMTLDSAAEEVDWSSLGLSAETGTRSRLAAALVNNRAPTGRYLSNLVADRTADALGYAPREVDLDQRELQSALLEGVSSLIDSFEGRQTSELQQLHLWIEARIRRTAGRGRGARN